MKCGRPPDVACGFRRERAVVKVQPVKRRNRAPPLLLVLLAAVIASFSCSVILSVFRSTAFGVVPRIRSPIRIALTREEGQNHKLRNLLVDRVSTLDSQVEILELPCIEHGRGADLEELERLLLTLAVGKSGLESPDCAVLTSPEAARVFLRSWNKAISGPGSVALPIPVVCIGRGTSAVLKSARVEVVFEPSVANAETLATELPEILGPKVWYPASASAQATLQDGLAARGFVVHRLNTYTTESVQAFNVTARKLMGETDIATFGSPSSVKAWAAHAPVPPSVGRAIAVCIGGTSYLAADAAGFRCVFAPTRPGIDGWADSVLQALLQLSAERAD
eukprot:TRINITY_DN35219_c0_g2_i1.p1 TRINITY_DN35219_c0_g2~~TRINITY_DN35219_c0_g2_i1.p1  ORF type:complete len:336 (-),score=31.55 TRINITY_DN35219_c0_g2_i1:182-1189(-)